MESHSPWPSISIKLEPDSETDCVHSSDEESPTETQVCDEIDNDMPASVKTEPPEVNLEHSSQEVHPSYESCPSISIQDHSQMNMYGTTEAVKQEQSEVSCEDRFSKMIDTASCDKIQEVTGKSKTESRLTENGYITPGDHENCSQMSENMSSVIEISQKISSTDENCQLQNVDTLVEHTESSVKPLDDTDGYTSCSPQRIQADGAPYTFNICNPDVNVNRHTTGHKSKKLHTCDSCGALFTAAFALKRHRRTHTEEKPYKCDECGVSFTQSQHLKSHTRTHTGERPYECDVCGASFTQAQHLKSHTRTHTGERPYDCDVCGSSFTQAQHLKRHKRLHTGEKPYKCDCGACFNEATKLKYHKTTHIGEKPVLCDEYDASFTETTILKYHKTAHTGEKNYKCDECGASFTQAYNLKRHKRTHTGEKPYQCGGCGACFAQSSSLKCHKRIHTGERPYTCDECGASFTQNSSLKSHKLTHTV